MEIGLIDNDLCTRLNNHFPNLALMKLSAYHKKNGDNVTLCNIEEFGDTLFTPCYDKIYCAKVFSDTPTPKFIYDKNIILGGSGFYYDKAEKLPNNIEHMMPDYSLYPVNIVKKINKNYQKYYTDYSIGFTTRGCIRKCSFCVNRNEKTVYKHSDICEFIDDNKPFIMLLDDNIMAFKDYKTIFQQLNNTNKKFVFKQGLDFRLLNDEKINVLINSNYKDTYHFAFDNIKDKKRIVEVFEKWIRIKKISSGNMLFYVLAGFDELGIYSDDFFIKDINDIILRVEILFKYGAYPYLMLHENIKKNPYNYFIQRMRKVLNVPMMINNKTIRQALEQDKKHDVVEWLKLLGHENFLKNGFGTI